MCVPRAMKGFSRDPSHTADMAASTASVLSSAGIRTGAYIASPGSIPPAANALMPTDFIMWLILTWLVVLTILKNISQMG